jgi:hypothetical protein
VKDDAGAFGMHAAALVFWLAFIVFLLSSSVLAQTNTARIVGEVRDTTGVPLRSATLTINDSQRGATRIVVTGQSGDYAAPNLPPGLYGIRAEADGYETVERTSVELQVGQDVRIDFALEAGQVSQKITVSQASPMVETLNDVLGGNSQQ